MSSYQRQNREKWLKLKVILLYSFQNTFRIIFNFRIFKSRDYISKFIKIFISNRIIFPSFFCIMNFPIKFDNQFVFLTIKISNITTDAVLSFEFCSQLVVS